MVCKLSLLVIAVGVFVKYELDSMELPAEVDQVSADSWVAPGFESVLTRFRSAPVAPFFAIWLLSNVTSCIANQSTL